MRILKLRVCLELSPIFLSHKLFLGDVDLQELTLSTSPVLQQSADLNLSSSPILQRSADTDPRSSPTPQELTLSTSPVLQQSADQNLSSSPILQRSADTDLRSSPTPQELTLSTSPVLQQSADLNLSSSPILQRSADTDPRLSPTPQELTLSTSPVLQQSADQNLSSSPILQRSADTDPRSSPTPQEVPQQSADPLQSPLRQSVQPNENKDISPQRKFISVDEEDKVEDKLAIVDNTLSSSTDIHDTVIPLTSTLQLDIPDQLEVSSERFSTPLDQSPGTSPRLDQSPSTSPIPNQYESNSQALDQSPTNSPTPNQHPTTSPPLDQSTTSPIPDLYPKATGPDISDSIREYSPTTETVPPSHESPPPDDHPYVKHLPSHPSSPPPMDLQSSLQDPLTTGNFSPDLVGRHFDSPLSEEDKISSLDALLGSSFPSLDGPSKPRVQKTTVDTMDTPKDTIVSNPLLDGSSDSESDIFGSTKKKPSPPLDDEKPDKSPGKALFEDSGDDDLDWLK